MADVDSDIVCNARNDTTSPLGRNIETGNRERSLVVLNQSQIAGGRSWFWYPLVAAVIALVVGPLSLLLSGESPIDPKDYAQRARRVLRKTPLIDGHNDLPWQLRIELHNRIYDGKVDLTKVLLGHTDIQRLRQGMVGGQFWSVYVDCDPEQQHFEDPSWAVRDTLEQIDVTRRFISEHPQHLEYCSSTACARAAFASGRVASMIGIEGGHQVGNSIASIRQMHRLGARYITLTHNCDNAFGTSASTVAAGGPDPGLAPFGRAAVREMNRLGMIVDLAHVSHQTMRDVLGVARAPVIFSHSGAYGVEPHLRNVPDDVLRALKDNGGVVMVVFVNQFLNNAHPEQATIYDVVDHIFHIASVCGWGCVGLGSDFSGTPHVPTGLEDVTKFPDLVQLVLERGATDEQVMMLVGENTLRAWETVERKAEEIKSSGEKPVEIEYEGRKWQAGYRDTPWMLRESRDRIMASDTGEQRDPFAVDSEGKPYRPFKMV